MESVFVSPVILVSVQVFESTLGSTMRKQVTLSFFRVIELSSLQNQMLLHSLD